MLSRLKECCFPRKSSRRSSATFRKNKVSPEISLKSWFDFVETAKDPTGTKGKIMPVTEDILTQHSSDNYWLALRGSVYCVADFINFHPGGKERILMGVGHDASMLFNIYHAHIDFETILHRCYVGPFVRDTGKDYINSLQPSSATSISGSEPQMPASLSCTWSQDKIMLVFTVHHSGEALVGTVLSIFASPLLCRFRMFSRKKAAAIQWTSAIYLNYNNNQHLDFPFKKSSARHCQHGRPHSENMVCEQQLIVLQNFGPCFSQSAY